MTVSRVHDDLADRIRARIRAEGPMTVADYMALCLSDPAGGYYVTRDPFGTAGDFITAPEVSQMFGELVGAVLAHGWQLAGRPQPFVLAEPGPGRGTLMADIVRVLRLVPGLLAAADLRFVEVSPVLRAAQARAVAPFGLEAHWHDSLAGLPDGPLLLVANEFFDALPVRQFVAADGVWRERVVGLGPEGELAFGIGAGVLGHDGLPAHLHPHDDGAVLETCAPATALMGEIARRIVAFGGMALIIDYGHVQSAVGDTFQALKAHRMVDPLATPGEADLTAHVDFGALARAAQAAGARVHGPVEQGTFLIRTGLLERAGQLGAGKTAAVQDELRAAVERLAGPEQMGRLFKVMAVTRAGIATPDLPGFSGAL